MDASARDALRVAASLLALLLAASNGAGAQTVSCYNYMCAEGEQCTSVDQNGPKANCERGRAQCLTVIKRTSFVVASVNRSCLRGSMMVNSHVGCKITVDGINSEEVCTCAGHDCNGAIPAVEEGAPLLCVQCHYQHDRDEGDCTSKPDDPRFAVSCPAANRCVTETQMPVPGVAQAIRYCGRWDGNEVCQRTSFGHVVCFCQGNLCNDRLLNDSRTMATAASWAGTSARTSAAAPSPVAVEMDPTAPGRSAGGQRAAFAAAAASQPLVTAAAVALLSRSSLVP